MKPRLQIVSPIAMCLLIACMISCKKSDTNQPAAQSSAKHYHLKGKVVSIDKQAKMLNVDNEAIPDFMDAMTMPYKVKPDSELDKLSAGDAITADVVVQDDKAWLENIAVINRSATPASK
jgi:protein SCO1